ncbi:hypothetical protein L7F22_067073 [Adiantum nelumboides]|nr:hypothetical protein [Adiantum nelumboides]
MPLPSLATCHRESNKQNSSNSTANNEEVVFSSEQMYEYCSNDEVDSNPTAEVRTDKEEEVMAKRKSVPKKNGKLRVCVDYSLLNAQTIKDPFPLPFTDMMLDEIVRHEMYSFMDGYSGYNELKIAPKDREKTTFITEWGAFMYLVMPLGCVMLLPLSSLTASVPYTIRNGVIPVVTL